MLLIVALLLLSARAAAAELFTLTLVHGATFETRYRPLLDPSDPDKVLLRTDQGNWIALPRDLIVSVVSEVDRRGFGRAIDAVTIELGRSANDAAPDAGPGGEPDDPAARLARALERRFSAFADSLPYSVDQFVEPEAAAGIPLPSAFEPMAPVGSPARFVSAQSRR